MSDNKSSSSSDEEWDLASQCLSETSLSWKDEDFSDEDYDCFVTGANSAKKYRELLKEERSKSKQLMEENELLRSQLGATMMHKMDSTQKKREDQNEETDTNNGHEQVDRIEMDNDTTDTDSHECTTPREPDSCSTEVISTHANQDSLVLDKEKKQPYYGSFFQTLWKWVFHNEMYKDISTTVQGYPMKAYKDICARIQGNPNQVYGDISDFLQTEHRGWPDVKSTDPHYFDQTRDEDLRFAWYSAQDTGVKGGLKYMRPRRSYVKALKVRGKYEDDIWLGDEGEEGEWAVAYHGSSFDNICEIISSGGLKEQFSSENNRYGRGIYCSPCPLTARSYSKQYMFKGHYQKSILQVRVHPKMVNIHSEDYWVVPEPYIRITGVCIYSV